jgi:CheY-like chemotaxis protein
MAGNGRDRTALGIARARFIEALPRKSNELKGALATLVASPDAEKLREEMRRRLHALYASAQVFREEALAEAVKKEIDRIDRARDGGRPLDQADLDALNDLAESLPSLAAGTDSGRSSLASLSPTERQASPAPAVIITSAEPAEELPDAGELRMPPDAGELQMPAPPDAGTLPESGTAAQGESAGDEAASEKRSIVEVLVIDDPLTQASVRSSLPEERFAVTGTADPKEAIALARATAPDVVLLDLDILLQPDLDIIARLRGDPLTDFIPVVLMLSEGTARDRAEERRLGVDDVVTKPFTDDSLLQALSVFADGPAECSGALSGLREATVEEIAAAIAEEIRHGLTGSIQTGRNRKIGIGEGDEVLSEVWASIGRVRAYLSRQSKGAVRFRDAPRRGGPAVLALSRETAAAREDVETVDLRGRRILVADDDPAVRWFFAGLLNESGAVVLEAENGKTALEQAREKWPDAVLADIVMPEIGGFALCRELKRDAVLADVPVILISWKEDFLQRMRELHAGADGYLRKEAGAAQILRSVSEVLRPRKRLETQLQSASQVSGRIEGLGMLALLETVARGRPDARVTVRDAQNLFEIDIRKGDLAAVTQTASDGAFVRGELALLQALGAGSGRYTVVGNDTPVRSIFKDPMPTLLRRTANRLGALLDSLSDTHLMQVKRIVFNEVLLESVLSVTPEEPTREVAARLGRGASPRELMVEGIVAAQELEPLLEDLARRGAIAEVLGDEGEDLAAEALALREERPGTLFHSTPPPATAHGEEYWPQGEADAGGAAGAEVDEDNAFGSGAADTAFTSLHPAEVARAELGTEPGGTVIKPEMTGEALWADADRQSTEAAALAPPEEPGMKRGPVGADGGAAVGGAATTPVEPETPGAPSEAGRQTIKGTPPITSSAAAAVGPGRSPVTAATAEPARPPATRPVAPGGGERYEAYPERMPESRRTTGETEVEDEKRGGLGFALLLVALFVIGFVGWKMAARYAPSPERDRWNAPSTGEGARENLPAIEEPPEATDKGEPAGEPASGEKRRKTADRENKEASGGEKPGDEEEEEAEEKAEEPVGPGKVLPFIDHDRKVEVGENEGLLVIEFDSDEPAPEVRIGDRRPGRPPLSIALPEGRHEVVFKRRERSSYRYVLIRPGQTRIIETPE